MVNDKPEKVISDLILKLRSGIIWKPGSAARHLLKRKLRGHLPTNASLADYELLIQDILQSADALIYVYTFEHTPYLTIADTIGDQVWLIIASFDGVMETAFVVENPASYLERYTFRYIGKLHEVLA
ncbi:MAG TPA: hypothetical protein PKE20_11100 [Promineifilum sp.]|nr:hypothetical protein [Promineifilum sp.]